MGEHASVIRNVVIHVANEQPLLADVFALPTASDAGLICTRVRSLDGKRPIFIDRIDSVFFFPYRVIRFIEIPPEEMERHIAETGATIATGAVTGAGAPTAAGTSASPADGPGDAAGRLPVLIPDDGEDLVLDEPETDLEIDEDFLRRIRDI